MLWGQNENVRANRERSALLGRAAGDHPQAAPSLALAFPVAVLMPRRRRDGTEDGIEAFVLLGHKVGLAALKVNR